MVDADTIVSDEAEIRTLVAQANRMLYMEGQVGSSGHVSMRDPDTDLVYINSLSASRAEIRPEDVVAVTLDGDPVDPDAPRPAGEREIHNSIYRDRPDITAVVHAHPQFLTLFSITGTDLQPVSQRGTVLADGDVPVLHRPGKIVTRDEGAMMVDAMDGHKQLLIENHGTVVCDTTIVRAFVRAYNLEKNAEWQYRAAGLGSPNPMADGAVDREYERNWVPSSIEKIWGYCEHRARRGGYLPDAW